MSVYLGEWTEEIDVYRAFQEVPRDNQIAVASYKSYGYEGDAQVLLFYNWGREFENYRLYFVSGSHCSCYGLENQWEDDEVNFEWLRKQIETHEDSEFWKEVDNWLTSIE